MSTEKQFPKGHASLVPERNIPTVLHVTNCEGGGVPRAIAVHAGNVPELKHIVIWPASNHEPDLPPEVEVVSIEGGMLARWWTMRRAVKYLKPTVVVAHSSVAGLWLRGTRRRCAVVYQPHAYVFEDLSRTVIFQAATRTIERILAPRSAVVIAITPHEAKLATDLGSRHVVRVRNSVSSPESLESPPQRNVVVTVGRIAPQKDPAFFAQVARQVQKNCPEAQFIWIGDGDGNSKKELERVGVKVTGWMSPEEVNRTLASSSVYLHTAAYEGFPISILEAAAVGLPIIVRDIPAFDGTRLRGAESPDDVALLINRSLDSREFYDELCTISAELMGESTNQLQADDLRAMYRDVLHTLP